MHAKTLFILQKKLHRKIKKEVPTSQPIMNQCKIRYSSFQLRLLNFILLSTSLFYNSSNIYME
jgi:hypothetical protein